MSRCCSILFIIMATLCCLGAIAVTVIAYYTCLLMYPWNINCSAYTGYYKFCCNNCNPYTRSCTIYMYSAGSIVAQSCLWAGFVVFCALAHCMARRARRMEMGGFGGAEIQMNMSGSPMVAYGTPVYGNGF